MSGKRQMTNLKKQDRRAVLSSPQLLSHDTHFFQHSYHKETCENTNGRNGIFQWFEGTFQCPGGNLLEKWTKWQQWLLLWHLSLAIHGNAISCFLPLRHLLNKNYHLVFKGGFCSGLPDPQPVLVYVPILCSHDYTSNDSVFQFIIIFLNCGIIF